jgi:hypothetical protein
VIYGIVAHILGNKKARQSELFINLIPSPFLSHPHAAPRCSGRVDRDMGSLGAPVG